jgi:pimeloyl-ACP methyl ester carboxylesterase
MNNNLNVMLVHGAFADGSCWAKVIPLLKAVGLNVTATQNPLTSLADDVKTVKLALTQQNGPVLLVGHSWGGAVITEAGNHPTVAGLVYVAAGAPDSGRSFGQWWEDYEPAPGAAEIQPYGDGFLALTAKGMKEDFAQDLTEEESSVVHAVQGPIAARCFNDRIGIAAWRNKPSWYIVAAQDRTIPPAVQVDSAKRMNATTITLASSHVPLLSQPRAVADFILKALVALSASQSQVLQSSAVA